MRIQNHPIAAVAAPAVHLTSDAIFTYIANTAGFALPPGPVAQQRQNANWVNLSQCADFIFNHDGGLVLNTQAARTNRGYTPLCYQAAAQPQRVVFHISRYHANGQGQGHTIFFAPIQNPTNALGNTVQGLILGIGRHHGDQDTTDYELSWVQDPALWGATVWTQGRHRVNF